MGNHHGRRLKNQVRFWIDAKQCRESSFQIQAETSKSRIGGTGKNFEELIRPIWQGATGLYSKSFSGNR
jgi:hypothetical protein